MSESTGNLPHIQRITHTRDELVSLTAQLFGAIDNSFLADRTKPLIVAVNGSYGSGKKIIPDIARLELLGRSARQYRGRANHDEYWFGKRSGLPVEVDFVNMHIGDFKRKFCSRVPDSVWEKQSKHLTRSTILREFMKERKRGGLTFIHNHIYFEQPADIEIYLEDPHHFQVFRHQQEDRLKNFPGLQMYFNDAVEEQRSSHPDEDCWIRYIEIAINNEDLVQSGKFKRVLEQAQRRNADMQVKALADGLVAIKI
jgi:hypothetical protein